MLMFGANIYTPAGFVNVRSGNGTNLSNISCIFLPVVILNVVLSLLIDYILICICLYISGKVSSRGVSGVRRSDLFINRQFMAGNLFIYYQLVEKYSLRYRARS